MGFIPWISDNWFTLLQSAGIIGSLLFTGITLWIDSKSRRVTNLITLTNQHRDIWSEFNRRPELARVLKSEVSLLEKPVTDKEEVFVTMIILHLSGMYQAMADRHVRAPERIEDDIRSFFSLPVPSAVWQKVRPFQDQAFAEYLENCLIDDFRSVKVMAKQGDGRFGEHATR